MLAALILGIVTGMRTFTGIAALLIGRGGLLGYGAAVVALGEYVVDLLPQTPSRLVPPALIARLVAAAVAGALAASATSGGVIISGAAAVAGALVGAYGGAALRRWLIARLGPIPAGLVEDAMAITLAWIAVTRLV